MIQYKIITCSFYLACAQCYKPCVFIHLSIYFIVQANVNSRSLENQFMHACTRSQKFACDFKIIQNDKVQKWVSQIQMKIQPE